MAVETVTASAAQEVVYPTLNNGRFKINLTNSLKGKVTVKIINMLRLTVNDLQFTKSLHDETFSVNMVASTVGQYMVEISMIGY